MDMPNNLTKRYYYIGEVADMLSENASLIRFWEQEFPMLSIKKTAGGKRQYTQENIALLFEIHALLKEKGYTIEGAKKRLNQLQAQQKSKELIVDKLQYLKRDIESLRKKISNL